MSSNKTILELSLPLAAFVIYVSCMGLFTPGFYSAETANWQAQSAGQDMVNLFLIVPCLLITSFLAFRNNKTATLLWCGTVLYLLYTFIIYCFDVHFNQLFVFYCAALGLSFYSVIYFFYTQIKKPLVTDLANKTLIRVTGIYFLTISVLFYFLWLSEILPATISHTVPKSLTDVGLPTNPVHIIDLSVFLPGLFITGLLILRKKPLGFLLAPVILTFFILMDITIGVLVVVMKQRGLEADLSVTVVMTVLAAFSLFLLIWYLKNIKRGPSDILK